MPWYYAGPDVRPVGPVSLDELHQRRLAGTIAPETYVIEQTGEPGAPAAWRRYRDVFPASAPSSTLPPVPGAFPTQPQPSAAHPLFPSAPHAPVQQVPTPLVASPHGHYPVRRTNTWCAWGFGLGIAAFLLTFACGIGLLIAAPALLICIVGLVQVQRHPDQTGRGFAIVGGVLSILAILISIIFLAYTVPLMFKNYQWTVTEQSSSNSE